MVRFTYSSTEYEFDNYTLWRQTDFVLSLAAMDFNGLNTVLAH